MEREVGERRRANASNKENPEEVAPELQQIEEKIDANREMLLERVKAFQVYLEKEMAKEKREVMQLVIFLERQNLSELQL